MATITHKRGDTLRKTISLTYDTGAAVNLTGVEAFSQLRDRPGGELIAEGTCEVYESLGRVTVTYTAEQINALDIGTYGFDVRIRSGEDVHTLYTEEIHVIEPYTVI